MKSASALAALYALFAIIATLINIGFQALVISLYSGIFSVQLSVLIGTAAGLPIKYYLEKRHIFRYKSKNLSHDGKLFSLYTFMGLFTTAIFWSVEYFFHLVFGTDTMRYVGGGIGLLIGNFVKYHLDKRYVFRVEYP